LTQSSIVEYHEFVGLDLLDEPAVPPDVEWARIAVVVGGRELCTNRVRWALAGTRACVLLVDPAAESADALVGRYLMLLRDGCAAEELALVGVGTQACAPLAAAVLLRFRGERLPAVVASVTGASAIALRPDDTPTERLVSLLATVASTVASGEPFAVLPEVALDVDRLLTANRC
jgi:hypothetical protein